MDSGVETGNESNDSTVVAHGQFFSRPTSSKEPVGEQAQPKLELHFKYKPEKCEILTARGIKDNFVIERPSPTIKHLSLVKASNTDDKDCTAAFTDSRNYQSFFAEMLTKMAMNFNSSFSQGEMIIATPLQLHDHCSKIKRKMFRRRCSLMPLPSQSRHELTLHTAVVTNNTELLERLLNQGKVSPNVTDGLERTPLHMAASRGYTEVVRILLSYGANPNLKDRIGNTPLHLAAVTSKTEIVDLLLKAGTNVKSTDQFGNNPLDLAKTKLRVLQNCKNSKIGNIKEEVENVIRILKLYLQKSNAAAEQVEVLSEICSRLSLSNSTDQIQDDVKNLLSNLDSLSLT